MTHTHIHTHTGKPYVYVCVCDTHMRALARVLAVLSLAIVDTHITLLRLVCPWYAPNC